MPRSLLRPLLPLILVVAFAIAPSQSGPARDLGRVEHATSTREQATSIVLPVIEVDARVAGCSVGGKVAPASAARSTGGCEPADPRRIHRVAQPSNAVVPALQVEPMVMAPAQAASPRWTGGFNLYRETAFVTQKDFRWCVAASVQMMVNIVNDRSDRTAATQQRMIDYAQASDHGPWGPGGGTDVTGWIAALRHFGAGKYRAVGARTPAAALRIAATAMRQTGRPAGMLVMDGRHAWILHGFESRTDPKRDRRARITSVRVSGPLYPIQQKHGYDLRPNTELSVRALAEFFQPSSVGALVGKYVVIVPVH